MHTAFIIAKGNHAYSVVSQTYEGLATCSAVLLAEALECRLALYHHCRCCCLHIPTGWLRGDSAPAQMGPGRKMTKSASNEPTQICASGLVNVA